MFAVRFFVVLTILLHSLLNAADEGKVINKQKYAPGIIHKLAVGVVAALVYGINAVNGCQVTPAIQLPQSCFMAHVSTNNAVYVSEPLCGLPKNRLDESEDYLSAKAATIFG